ncbi:toll/interleukin-1 receptor domain-containing protein [Fodinibius sediminis]|uniref:SEFIR domain-containing protein n=1 Tax=Fodinibius sediminis TaxID=1214077 RepID=A0A521EET3_9BACT|nr:toll/interleukin-1 receptor domain-containing protein [Fodinibius sediminis]SMO82424.1 SEFIR domain-containing protein [Fodinibius sediminis]
MPSIPKAFISYSWDSETHKKWVKSLSKKLRKKGVDVTLDQWETAPGDQLPEFMEKAIRENDYILVVCTPRYKKRSDNREGGVGYEGDIMTGEALSNRNKKKFIPLIRKGDKEKSMPTWLKGRYFIDFRDENQFERYFSDLLVTIHGEREKAPPIGEKPNFKEKTEHKQKSKKISNEDFSFDPIEIEGVVVDEVTSPRNDNTRGSALYKIPFKLTRNPSFDWSESFIRYWDRPPRYTSMHRPGIASVIGDKIILDGTTIKEVEKYHRDTLLLAVEEANKEIKAKRKQEWNQKKKEKEQEEEHKKNIRNISDRLDFNT